MLRGDLYKPWWANSDWGVEILDGIFQGVVVQIESLNFPQDTSSPELELAYHVISKPETLEESIENSELFAEVLSTIINDIIKEAINFYEQDRANGTSESNQ